MLRTRVPALAVTVLVAACTAQPPVGPKPGGTTAPRPKPTATSSAAPTQAPTSAPSAAPTAAPTATPIPVPTNVPSAALANLAALRPGLDAKLQALAQVGFTGGRAQFVEGQLALRGGANRGASLISDRGGSLLSNNGGGLVGDAGGGYRLLARAFGLLQAALPAIDPTATADEPQRGIIVWADGRQQRLYRSGTLKLVGRTIDVDTDGKAFCEIAVTSLAPAGTALALGYRETQLLGADKAFGLQLTDTYQLDALTGKLLGESGTARYREPASGVDITFSKYEVDHAAGKGTYARAIAPYGLSEAGSFTVDPTRAVFSFTDPLQRSPGEATVSGADGKAVYVRKQTLEDADHVLVQAFDLQNGFVITFRLDDRVAGEPAGSVTLDGQPVGTATRTVSPAGAVGFAVALADEPGKPLSAEVAPPAGAGAAPTPAPEPGYDTCGVAAGPLGPGAGMTDALGEAARFDACTSVVALDDRTMYVADTGNNRVRELTREPGAKRWTVKTLAGGAKGGADGPAATATFDYPLGVALASIDAQNDTLLVSEGGAGHRIRAIKLTAPDRPVTTILGGEAGHADGDGAAVRFKKPFGMCQGPDGTIFVADERNACVRMLKRAAGAWSAETIAGDPAKPDGLDGRFVAPNDVAYDAATKTLWVADRDGGAVRAIDLTTPGAYPVRTVVGPKPDLADGPAATAGFGVPSGIALDGAGNVIVPDWKAKRVRMITPAGEVRSLAGRDFLGLPEGPATQVDVGTPWGVDVLPGGEVVFCDVTNDKVRIVYRKK